MPTKKILLIDDISKRNGGANERSRALHTLTAQLAKTLKAEAHFLYIEDLPENLRKRTRIPPLEKRNPLLISELNEDLAATKIPWTLHFDSGLPVEKILKWNRGMQPYLTVMGTKGLRGLSKFVLGSVAEEVLRRATNPIVVVGPNSKETSFMKGKKSLRILVLTDLSGASLPCEEYAKHFAKAWGAQVTLFHAVGETALHLKNLAYSSRFPIYDIDAQIEDLKSWSRKELQKRQNQFQKEGVSTRSLFSEKESPLKKIIPDIVENNYDFLVMGTHARNKLLTAFFGSSAREACRVSPCPVIIVRATKGS
ncbi:universal stress protein [Bdellovibrio sp. HCB2-146]|uniref:universal stress protein n=1 Tax=Bdellovibrio sp. HCB2-146 TaxID=3394362 RepID=UPI0039BCE183